MGRDAHPLRRIVGAGIGVALLLGPLGAQAASPPDAASNTGQDPLLDPNFLLSPPQGDLTTVHPGFLTPDPPFRSRDLGKWKDGDPIPFGYHRTEPLNLPVIVGPTLFTVSYFASLMVGGVCAGEGSVCATPHHEDFLFVPGVGPFLQMLQTRTTGSLYVLALDGLAQLGGIGLFVYGILAPPKPILELDELPRSRLTISTFVSPRGLALVGTF